ncbi:MAG: AAA family ATPase [Actinomycetota bacterium]|nr:AAA family ATPase [Actinomycetota bacterium]
MTATAFGPFAASVHVDLDDLSRDGLFLLCGPTGAGKTSLLDAIAFALYGRVPGARGQEKRLRSDHARDSVRTEVVCELTLRGERLRITRRPEQVRPKARGGGSTRDQALLHVQRQVNRAWDPVSTRLDEGGDYLRQLIGLSAEQFWQVVLLPQGEFAEFLRAEPDQRAKVLETLFDARRFTDVEDWLAEHARMARAELAVAEAGIDRLLHRVEQAARGLSAPIADEGFLPRPATEDPEHVRGYVTSQLARAQTQLALASQKDAATKAALSTAETCCDQARRAVRAVERLMAACRQRDFVHDGAEAPAEQQTRLSAASRAEPLRHMLEAHSTTIARVRQTAEQVTDTYAELSGLDAGKSCPVELLSDAGRGSGQLELASVSSSQTAAAGLRGWSRTLRVGVARLADLEAELGPLEADERRLAELVEAQASRQAKLDDLTEIASQLPVGLADLEARRDAARVSAAGVPHAADALAAAQARLEAGTRARQLTQLISAATAEQVQDERSALAAKAHWLQLRETRLAGIAAELAGQLAAGQDCPVCGSPEHPAPAQAASTIVTAGDERVAAERYERLEEARELAAARVIVLRGALEVCSSVTSGARLTALRKELAAAVSADRAARAAAEQLPSLIAEHAALVAGRAELASELTRLTEAQTADRAAANELSSRVRSGRLGLDKARGPDASLAARRDRLAALADGADALEQAWSAHQLAATAADISRTRLEEGLRRSDFPGASAALAALLDQATRDELSTAVRDHEDAKAAASAELLAASADLQDALSELATSIPESAALWPQLRTQDIADLSRRLRHIRTVLDAEHRSTAQLRDRAVGAISRARATRDQLGELRVLLDQALADCDPLREAGNQATALAALAAGGGANLRKMRLRSYVLAARLEQVASAATARLRQMSSGRFGFVHSDDLRGGNRRSGLSVDILDSHTGTQRPTKTLSGGESFMAALALALGLADVVTAESGGITLDTLFVDEGFGSLDPESLDAVMTVLDELRQSGRVVGIVSHVEELRTRVPMQLKVHTSSHGSTLDQSGLTDPTAEPLAG